MMVVAGDCGGGISLVAGDITRVINMNLEAPVQQWLPNSGGGLNPALGVNFADALQKPGSFDFSARSVSSDAELQSAGAARRTEPEDSAVGEDAPSRFAYLYKTKGIKDAQRLRMEESLRRQKEKRYDYLNHVRQLTAHLSEGEDLEEVDTEQMEWTQDKKGYRKKRNKPVSEFKNQLMYSEWLLEKPEHFVEDWIMVAAPEGKRNLVIAARGQTVAYAKNGRLVNHFPSHLPGGAKHKHMWNTETAILDCIYNTNTKTYYVLDMMFWKQTPMYDTETQFRFYWLHEKFLEVPEIGTISKRNPYRFEPLPKFHCDAADMSNVLQLEMNVPLDGLLFYHKEAHYTFGYTPLVLWLQPYMVPEALDLMVPQKFIERAPQDYRGFVHFREQCIADLAAREEAKQSTHEKQTSSLEEETMQI